MRDDSNTTHRMTPLHLELLTFYHAKRKEVPTIGAAYQSVKDAITDLEVYGLLARNLLSAEVKYDITDRGIAWLTLVLQTPLPQKKDVVVWVDPRNQVVIP